VRIIVMLDKCGGIGGPVHRSRHRLTARLHLASRGQFAIGEISERRANYAKGDHRNREDPRAHAAR
jgi:hypothetical protein